MKDIMPTRKLSNKYLHTLARISQHPTSRTLQWHDVISLIEHLGKVENDNGHLTFTVNGVSQVFHRSHDKEVSDAEQILDLRHFLETVGIEQNSAIATEALDPSARLRLLVVINQQETLIFRSEGEDSVPERLHPYDPRGVLHHLTHIKGADKAARLPENITYYQEIAEALAGAEEVLIMGNGTGASSAMEHLKDFLAAHHEEIANKIVGSLTVDIEALTEGELLQQAREFYMARDGLDARAGN